jgi:hypothetical protein
MRFSSDVALTALDGEGLINAVAIAVDDDDLTAVFARQPANDRSGQRSAFPMAIAIDEDTHVQIIANWTAEV